ncbi:hypothetical protein ACOSQ3_024606 [Xanthoceras sorbifolium]
MGSLRGNGELNLKRDISERGLFARFLRYMFPALWSVNTTFVSLDFQVTKLTLRVGYNGGEYTRTGMRDPLVLVVRSWPGDSGVVGFMDVPATLIYQPLDSTKRFVMGLTSYFREIGSWA